MARRFPGGAIRRRAGGEFRAALFSFGAAREFHRSAASSARVLDRAGAFVSGHFHVFRDCQLSKATDAAVIRRSDDFSESLRGRFRSDEET